MSTKELWIVMSESDGETDAIAVNGKYAAQDIFGQYVENEFRYGHDGETVDGVFITSDGHARIQIGSYDDMMKWNPELRDNEMLQDSMEGV